jgi:hypothetical protein
MFLALTIQMGHVVRETETTGQHWIEYTPSYGTTMNRDRYLHILRYLHLLTTAMDLIGQTKILTDYGRYETRFNF